ncbi:hypothetical protein [Halalkalibacter akibai]|uniref:Uncharacterized protein n=1 Tax=Halalkalibacter akibai (strain ATCC 43226 / DSM 21942 / CIP 109018 / JCM 9157 / 1139) TaxID=1236973 RepID=W4QUD1_HALA3|nr:hypothetical protein [Halalkalibacter akibai]GAE35696.1 hypothetical protein JCM9157_2814 [Halalkalibacter akibai JCM 9157]
MDKEKATQITHAAIRGTLGAVSGGILAEVFNLVIADPASKRRDNALSEITERILNLEKKDMNLDELAENDEFISVVMKAYNIYLRTHQKEKRLALLNAVENTPILDIDESIKQMYLNYIDEFNEWHLEILHLLDNPTKYLREDQFPYMGGLEQILVIAFPELKDKAEFYKQVTRDLYDRGLMNTDGLGGTMTGQGLKASRTTNFGKEFISYITLR